MAEGSIESYSLLISLCHLLHEDFEVCVVLFSCEM